MSRRTVVPTPQAPAEIAAIAAGCLDAMTVRELRGVVELLPFSSLCDLMELAAIELRTRHMDEPDA